MNGYLLPFLGGLPTGIIMSFMMGTVFFALINNSINYGPINGVLVAAGVVLSDIIFTAIALFGSQYLPVLDQYEQYVRWIGGLFIIFLGVSQISNQRKLKQGSSELKPMRKPLLFVSEGFLLNMLNPMNLVTWVAITAYLTNVYHLNLDQKTYFFAGAVIGIFAAESGISLAAHRLKVFLNSDRLKYLNYSIGALFFLFGFLLLIG